MEYYVRKYIFKPNGKKLLSPDIAAKLTQIHGLKGEQGIACDERSEEGKAAYESAFADESGEFPGRNQSSALDEWVFKEDLAPLIMPDEGVFNAMRFDALMYGIELACLVGKKYARVNANAA